MKFTCSELRSMFWSEMVHLKDSGTNIGFKEYWSIWRKDTFDAEKYWPMSKASYWLTDANKL